MSKMRTIAVPMRVCYMPRMRYDGRCHSNASFTTLASVNCRDCNIHVSALALP